MKNILFTAALGLIFTGAQAQDIHFARTKDMQKWYNASLRNEDNERTATFNFRNVSYKQLIAFKSVAALVDIPLMSKATIEAKDKKGYLSIAGGFAVDKSNQGILRNTTGLVGVSYHLPVDVQKNTFISMGVQGSYFESRINMNGVTTPDQFDKYGMLPNTAPNDPGTAGKINFISVNAGVSVSHTDDKKKWYAGFSARHLNRPQANMEDNADYRLPVTSGMQAGFQTNKGNEAFGIDMMLNFKASAYEHIATAYYIYTFENSDFIGSVGANLGYRYKDAIIPGVQLRIFKTVIGFNYDMATGNNKSELSRVAYELGLKQVF